jgi:hypothetical protein
VPASSPIARRSGAVASALLLVATCSLVAACSDADGAAEESRFPFEPEGGTVRTSVEAPVGTEPPDGGEPSAEPALPGRSEEGLGRVLLVGDSVLVLAVDELAGRVHGSLDVDAADCRRLDLPVAGPCGGVPRGVEVDSGLGAISEALAASDPPDSAVFVLANNSTLEPAGLDAAMEAAAGVPHVWWVNARIDGLARQDVNNRALAELAERDPRAGVVDWYGASEGQDWLSDGVHPDPEGQAALAALIDDRLRCRCTR